MIRIPSSIHIPFLTRESESKTRDATSSTTADVVMMSARVPVELREKAKYRAIADGVSLQQVIRDALDQYL